MEPEMKPIPGRLVVFLVGQTDMNLETTDVYTMASENFSMSFGATLEFVMLAGWFLLLLLYVAEFFFLKG